MRRTSVNVHGPLSVLGFRVQISNNVVHPAREEDEEDEDDPDADEDDEESEDDLHSDSAPPKAASVAQEPAGAQTIAASSEQSALPDGADTDADGNAENLSDTDDEEEADAAVDRKRVAAAAKQPPIARDLSLLVSVCVSVKFKGFESALKSTPHRRSLSITYLSIYSTVLEI